MQALPLVEPHPSLQKDFAQAAKGKLHLIWVVDQVSSQGKRQQRVLVVTQKLVLLCTVGGDTRRANRMEDLAKVSMRAAAGEVMLGFTSPQEPAILFFLTQDERSRPQPPSASALVDMLSQLRQQQGVAELPVEHLDEPLQPRAAALGVLAKPKGYSSPKEKMRMWKTQPPPRLQHPAAAAAAAPASPPQQQQQQRAAPVSPGPPGTSPRGSAAGPSFARPESAGGSVRGSVPAVPSGMSPRTAPSAGADANASRGSMQPPSPKSGGRHSITVTVRMPDSPAGGARRPSANPPAAMPV
eukprot:TRINITY_DN2808_c0_g1_i1.p1 TRINITY_DN2808_c0_g1~~TRINITY_DN2808_c0_g1_i1.p1  ORF type:complete len:327 (+),score=86.23 TRINITY_DN2808_c0_g1_i1:89-982(+)